MFNKFKMYRHRSALDIDILVVNDPVDFGDEWLLKVKYWNPQYKGFHPDSISVDSVFIKKSQIKNWKEV